MRTRLLRLIILTAIGVTIASCSSAQVASDTLAADAISISNIPETTSGITDKVTQDVQRRQATVRSRSLNLRSKPRLRTRALIHMSQGDTAEVIKVNKNGWVKLRTHDGITGWAWGPLLNVEGRKWITAKYKGMTHILYSRLHFMGPDGVKRSRLVMRGLYLGKPLKAVKLTSNYGIRKKHPVNGGNNKMHQGVDILAKTGTNVYTAASGVVKSVKQGKSYGLYLDIEHKLGYTTRYAHLSRILVKKGQRIRAGKLIAKSGNTGATTGPHLHFELRQQGRSVNPKRYVKGI